MDSPFKNQNSVSSVFYYKMSCLTESSYSLQDTILTHLFYSPFSLSLSFSVSLLLSPTNFPIYHSLSYPPHRLNSLQWKEEKGGKRIERDEEGIMRERDRWRSQWVREGGRLKKEREIEREKGGVKQMCQNCIPTMNMNNLCLAYQLNNTVRGTLGL